jgi:hypothetical protein
MFDPQPTGYLTKFEKQIYTLNSKGVPILDRDWTAVLGTIDGERQIIGYAYSSTGFHKLVDRTGIAQLIDEGGLERPLIDPVEIIGPSIVVGIARGIAIAGGRVLITRGITVAAEQAATRGAGSRLAAAFRRMLMVARSLLVRGAVREVSGPAGSVARSFLEAAMKDPGPTIRVVVNLTSKPQVGRALSVAVEEGAEALAGAAGAARGIGRLYIADIPKALIVQLEKIGLAELRTGQIQVGQAIGTFGKEYRFLAEASEFIVPFFR